MTIRTEPLRLSRRGFLAAGAGALAATALGGWTPVHAVPAGSSGATLPTPAAFPDGIALYQQAYQNWSKEIMLDAIWTCAPRSPEDVVRLANWAHAHGYTIRPRGAMHGWTPLTIVNGAPIDKVILADTMVHLNAVSVNPGSAPATVTAGAGATLDAITTALQANGLGWANLPAPGVLSVAGSLAVNAHGAALPADGEAQVPGNTFGSLSNLVTELTVVAWNGSEYALRTVTRADADSTALLTHLGRTFVTSVTLQAGPNTRMRCQSYTDIDWRELFAPAGAAGRTFESFVRASGRAEAIWYPFTDKPWMKVWSLAPERPATSREVFGPYNYPFSDNVPEPVTDLLGQMTAGNPAVAPAFGQVYYNTTVAGLAATNSSDIWGWSKDLQFYIKATTLRLTEGGGAVLTNRANIANVIHDFTQWFHQRIEHYRALGQYPLNGPVEIRCCGLDQPDDVQVPSAGPPTISATRPRPDHPEWDTAIWLNVLGVPGTPGMFAFYREMEQWMRGHYDNGSATFRPEWSKGWAFGPELPYTDQRIVEQVLPDTYREGVPADENWDSARAVYNRLDPHRIFSNSFIDRLLP
ncbi:MULTISPECIES: cholesterol oxidase substrate-binding domain-containing protein [Rhodococcus]|uniref:cholesterol oxidase substrate-binding domain-containing protein n=1 Tax=Rhodococcus TaxID=1827 RepID=UPI00065F97B1|nr:MULTISPECIES: cholesterol oxidase substrate-binding domain-containing protein [Rhodococcus]RIK14013.1 MAG: FAD-binding protein [Acidobacteriota bacterium]AUM16795.1 FAD-binding protein [Rhodococcus ruber]AXY50373.1 FAD-linked oxidase [Rhodococcus ruber]MBD8054657.1 FAD-binding protein [Rhodococcus ruber]MCF8785864.1 FAD-binding protein [Rhodococcus ruber]